jgi:hypothetical protein
LTAPCSHHGTSTIAAPSNPIPNAVVVSAASVGSSMNVSRASGMVKMAT